VADSAARSAQSGRLLFLDLFRGLAVFFMFDAHITHALVNYDRSSSLHQYHNLMFNLPAPAFLFAAGLSFGMSVSTRWHDYRNWTPVLRSRLMRVFEILLLGYLLHLPSFSLRGTLFASSERQRMIFLGMDVLQCIGYGLFALLALAWIVPDTRWFLRACIMLAAAISLVSPVVWTYQLSLPWWIDTYLSKRWGSNFPLFPYVGFVFAGTAWGYLFADARRTGSTADFKRRMVIGGAALIVASAVAARLPLPAPYDNFWNASPQFFAMRLGFFATMLGALSFAESHLLPALSFLVPLSRESLLVYVVHLVIIYGSLANRRWNLNRIFADGVGFWGWLGIYALLTVSMVLLATWGTSAKEKAGRRFDRLQWATATVAAAVFVVA
jgi:hypothetical protein